MAIKRKWMQQCFWIFWKRKYIQRWRDVKKHVCVLDRAEEHSMLTDTRRPTRKSWNKAKLGQSIIILGGKNPQWDLDWAQSRHITKLMIPEAKLYLKQSIKYNSWLILLLMKISASKLGCLYRHTRNWIPYSLYGCIRRAMWERKILNSIYHCRKNGTGKITWN